MKRTGEEMCSCWIIQTYTSVDIHVFFFCKITLFFSLLARLNQTYRQLLNDNELLTTDHKQLKSQLNEVKLEHTWLEADFNKLKKEFQQLDISCTKLSNQCEVLEESRARLLILMCCICITMNKTPFCVMFSC